MARLPRDLEARMLATHWVLDGRTARPARSLDEIHRMWMEPARHLAEDFLTLADDTVVYVSTVFLVIDHRWGAGDPLLFETLVFNGPLDGEMARYSTYAAAEAGHAAMVARCRAAIDA